MPKSNPRKFYRYHKESFGKSVFDGNPTLVVHHYRVPNSYKDAVNDVIAAYKNGIPFNRAVDQVFALDTDHLNRSKLVEHALKTIANDY